MFVEVILPLPLYSTFTYSVPQEMEEKVQIGSRVLVQFGRKKYYTGLVEAYHNIAPKGYEVKPITAVLDSEPIIKYPQIKFWKWIAEYYLCSVGEVYKAAVPTGLKPESETFLALNPDYEPDETQPFRPNEKQSLILHLFQEKKRLKLCDIENETGFKNVTVTISPLIEEGILEISEHISDIYKAKKKTYIEFSFSRNDKEKLHESFSRISRSRLQEKALISYLDLSGWLNNSQKLKKVEKATLMNTAGVSTAVVKALVDKGIFNIVKKKINRFDLEDEGKKSVIHLPNLTLLQKQTLNEIENNFKAHDIQLLHGVTGSGKTEIYSHLIAKTLEMRNQVLFLVPEISLTTQLSDRLKTIFGNKLIVYHSKFSDSERVDIWKKILETNEPYVILGVRSSIFLPFSHLGLIIVDEEHESSFKQYDPAPRYNARDAAMVLAKLHGAKTLLGSATPSVETYFKAQSGKFALTTLSERYEGASLPDVEVIDMREMRKRKEVNGILSHPLTKRITETLKKHNQSIMFQNRRGFAPVVVCEQCGWSPKCQNCDVSLIYHKNLNLLKCHYCGYSSVLPALCPACGQNNIKIFGYGTERITEELKEVFPEATISRMDLDSTRNKDSYQEIIENFARHETDILVGTQMVTKGLDFCDVTTVGVLNADTLLNFPDFRSNERAFNMLEQVAGRAGRRKEKGIVMIQTVNPKHEILQYVKDHDYQSYYKDEIETRARYNYPPFTKIINITIKNKDSEVCDRAAVLFTLALRKVFGERVLGPEKPFISKIANYFIQSIMLKVETGASMKKVKDLLRHVLAEISKNQEIKSSIINYDIDPV